MDYIQAKNRELTSDKQRIANEIHALKNQKNKLLDLLLSGTIDNEIYRGRAEEVQSEIAIRELEASENGIDEKEFKAKLEYAKHFILNIGKLWAGADADVKRDVQNLVFPAGIYLDQKTGFRTPDLSPVFKYLPEFTPEKIAVGVPKGI